MTTLYFHQLTSDKYSGQRAKFPPCPFLVDLRPTVWADCCLRDRFGVSVAGLVDLHGKPDLERRHQTQKWPMWRGPPPRCKVIARTKRATADERRCVCAERPRITIQTRNTASRLPPDQNPKLLWPSEHSSFSADIQDNSLCLGGKAVHRIRSTGYAELALPRAQAFPFHVPNNARCRTPRR